MLYLPVLKILVVTFCSHLVLSILSGFISFACKCIFNSPWCKTYEWRGTEVFSKRIVLQKAKEICKLLWVICLACISLFFSLCCSFVVQLMKAEDLAKCFFLLFYSSKPLRNTRLCHLLLFAPLLGFASVMQALSKTKIRGLINFMTCYIRVGYISSINLLSVCRRQERELIWLYAV
jgi:hypothetical protein